MTPPTRVAVRSRPRGWTDNAIRLIEADARRSADTHLLRSPGPGTSTSRCISKTRPRTSAADTNGGWRGRCWAVHRRDADVGQRV
ncbi:cysteine synthase CysK domain protein [Mycobacterium xenopi 4042]|uniref:Cysteine synthase CysK domain protein n=1 Tax=Mycobacterium xenopi 4042 TaxID=1299334 RepID=X8EEN1_MYCXE|nr:cysteine synthase CysK domain protein [Mycobacterium xenopi 4042]